jgi:hypothetical protein
VSRDSRPACQFDKTRRLIAATVCAADQIVGRLCYDREYFWIGNRFEKASHDFHMIRRGSASVLASTRSSTNHYYSCAIWLETPARAAPSAGAIRVPRNLREGASVMRGCSKRSEPRKTAQHLGDEYGLS